MKNRELFERIIEKYKLDSPVPQQIQLFMSETKRSVLIGSLKAVGSYTRYFGLVLSVYYRLRKMSIIVSINEAIAFIIITGFIITSSVVSGGYFLIKKFTQRNTEEIEKRENTDIKNIEIKTETGTGKKSTGKIIIRKKTLRKYKESGSIKKENIIKPSDKRKTVNKDQTPSKKTLSEEEIIDRVQSIPPL
jgi:hypothetical protein